MKSFLLFLPLLSCIITSGQHSATAFTVTLHGTRVTLPKHHTPSKAAAHYFTASSQCRRPTTPTKLRDSLTLSPEPPRISVRQKIASLFSQKAAVKATFPFNSVSTDRQKFAVQLITLLRVSVPALLAGAVAFLLFPCLALTLARAMNDAGVFHVLSSDSSAFVQNFLTVIGLLFSLLIGQCYDFLYSQQAAVYYALFNEVTEAKSLLEQVALVCQGRSMYPKCLESINRYVQSDLKQLRTDPAVLLSKRPVDDPLESIMYLTSVGVPSSVYETVRSLRQARATRLGALQRKVPTVHMLLLWLLAGMKLVAFPLLGAGTQSVGGYNILTVEGILFGIMTFGIVMALRVVGELWRPAGGAYNVDGVLSIMVKGMEEELSMRMKGKSFPAESRNPTVETYIKRIPPRSNFAENKAGTKTVLKKLGGKDGETETMK